MLAGVNDRYEQALGAGKTAARGARAGGETIFKVNLIPWNPVDTRPAAGRPTGPLARFKGSSRESIAAFKAVLVERGMPATVRLTRGRDIDAACGQLAAKGG